MSNMMHNLRKYQKVVIAVSGVLIIFVFTVGDQIMGWLNARPEGEAIKTTVVAYKGGRISEVEMQMMVGSHYRATRGVERVGREGLGKGQMPSGYYVYPGYVWGIPPTYDEQTVLQIRLLAEKARSLGLTVDDTAVYQFLRRLYGVPSTSQAADGDIRLALQDELGEQMSFLQFVEQLKIELLAQHMRYLGRSVLSGTDPQTMQPAPSPAEAFAYFERLNRESQIEAFPVKVEDFLSKVKGKPTDKQLQELFDKFKEQEPSPYMPEPGFRIPPKVAVHYVKVDFNKMLEEEKAKITEEQVKEEYEKGVAAGRFNAASLPDAEPATEEPKQDDEKPADEKKDGDEKKAETPAEEAKPDDKKADAPAEEAKSEDKKADAPAEEAKPDEKKEEPVVPAEPKVEEPKADGVCVQEDAKTEEEKPADEKPADEKPAEEKPNDEKPAEEKPADPPTTDTPAEVKPGDEKPAEETPAETTKPAAEKAPATEEGKPAEAPKVLPLDKVRDQILRTLASQPAQERLTKAFTEIEKEVRAFAIESQPDRSAARDEQDPKKQAALKAKLKTFDVAAAAKAQGLEYRIIPLSGPLELDEFEIGRAFSRAPTGLMPFIQSAFQPSKQLYQPEAVRAFLTGAEYLYWLTDQQEGYVPEFADVREEVAQAWKTQEARKLAEEAAKTLAADVTKGKSLKDIHGDKTIESGKFTWLRGPNTPYGAGGQPQLSEVTGIDQAGDDFMRAVFNLGVGETGVAPNQSRNIFYVVRVTARIPSDDILREQFVGSRMGHQSVMPVAQLERRQLEQLWFQDLAKEFDVEWKRDPRDNR